MMRLELEGMMLSEVSQSEKANYHMTLNSTGMWNLRNKAEDHRGREEKIKQGKTRDGDNLSLRKQTGLLQEAGEGKLGDGHLGGYVS